MKFTQWLGMAALVGVTACATPQAGNVTRLSVDPPLTGGTYSTGGGITVASELRNIGGQAALCGLWSESASQTPYSKGKAKDILASGAAYLGGQRLLTGLDYFASVPAGTDYSQADAPCQVTDRAWSANHASIKPEIRLPQQVVYRDRNSSNGIVVDFKQTGPGALSGSLDLVQTIFRQPVRFPLGPAPTVGGGRYSSGGSITAAVEVRQVGKEAYVCGVWKETRGQDQRTEKQAPEVLARGNVTAGGLTLVEDLRFMRRISAGRPFANARANCIATGVLWADLKDGSSVAVRFPQFVVFADPARTIIFSPTGSGA